MAKAAAGNPVRRTKICRGGSHMSRGNKLTRSPRHQFLPPVVAVKWAHVQKTKLPNKIANDVKLPRKPAYDRPRASLPPKRAKCEKLMLKGNDAS